MHYGIGVIRQLCEEKLWWNKEEINMWLSIQENQRHGEEIKAVCLRGWISETYSFSFQLIEMFWNRLLTWTCHGTFFILFCLLHCLMLSIILTLFLVFLSYFLLISLPHDFHQCPFILIISPCPSHFPPFLPIVPPSHPNPYILLFLVLVAHFLLFLLP